MQHKREHARTHARTHARKHTRTNARMHARTNERTHAHRVVYHGIGTEEEVFEKRKVFMENWEKKNDRGRMTETGIWFQITGYTGYQAVREKACMNWFIETMTSASKSGYCSFISLTEDLEARLNWDWSSVFTLQKCKLSPVIANVFLPFPTSLKSI